MLSWIFRNRLRLRVIYGTAVLPPLPGTRFAEEHRWGWSAGATTRAGRQRPGEVRVLSRHVVVRPMPRRVPS
jgi:hypothetical protein